MFWLSKELFDEEFKQTTAPDARELHDIRNALEHKLLQLHEGWAVPFMRVPPSGAGLGISISSDALEAKALRVMRIARSAIFLLSFAIGVEERLQRRGRPDDHILGAMPITNLEDRRKGRDPM